MPFNLAGDEWVSAMLGARGHIYRNVKENSLWLSFGFKKYAALFWGPLHVVTRPRADGTRREFFQLRQNVMGARWVTTYFLDDPKEPLDTNDSS